MGQQHHHTWHALHAPPLPGPAVLHPFAPQQRPRLAGHHRTPFILSTLIALLCAIWTMPQTTARGFIVSCACMGSSAGERRRLERSTAQGSSCSRISWASTAYYAEYWSSYGWPRLPRAFCETRSYVLRVGHFVGCECSGGGRAQNNGVHSGAARTPRLEPRHAPLPVRPRRRSHHAWPGHARAALCHTAGGTLARPALQDIDSRTASPFSPPVQRLAFLERKAGTPTAKLFSSITNISRTTIAVGQNLARLL